MTQLDRSTVSGRIEGLLVIKGRRLSEVSNRALVDFKTCYLGGRIAQQGQSINNAELIDWFWGETCAAKLLNEVRKSCMKYAEQDMVISSRALIVPMNQQHRFDD